MVERAPEGDEAESKDSHQNQDGFWGGTGGGICIEEEYRYYYPGGSGHAEPFMQGSIIFYLADIVQTGDK